MIHRAEHEDNFTVISNDIICDSALSDGAKTLLLFMLSCRDDWKFSNKGLASCLGLSIGAVNSRVKELQERGYISIKKNRGSRGYFGECDWDVFEQPHSNLPNSVYPYSDLPNIVSPNMGKLECITNTNTKQILNITKTKGTKKKVFVPPTLQEVEEYCQSRNSDVDPKKFFEYYEEGHWKDAKGNPVKNWKQKLITWEGRQKKPKTGPIQGENPFTRLRREEGFI